MAIVTLKQFLFCVLIAANIQLSIAQENIETKEETAIKDENSTIRCKDGLPVIKNGKYIIVQEIYKAQYNDRVLVNFECNDKHFVLEPPIYSDYCDDGIWEKSVYPECLPLCNSENWNSSWTKCVPDCGLRNQPDDPRTADELQIGDYPYHVGIYFRLGTKDKSELKFICGGSIISTRLIVTAAYCVTIPKSEAVISLDLYDVFVGAGKFYNNYDSSLDTNAQTRQVIKLELSDPRYFYGATFEYEYDLSILVVDEPLNFDNFVQPACVEWYQGFHQDTYSSTVRKYYIGHVAGWGDNKYNVSTTLNSRFVINIFRVHHYYITSRKICTNSEEGCDICVGDIGSGWVVAKNIKGVTKYYLRKLVSGNGFDTNICAETTQNKYAELFNSREFLINKLIEYPNIITLNKSTNCKVPFISNGRLIISRKPYSSRKPIPNHSIVYIECNSNTYLYPQHTKYVICKDKKFNKKVPKCLRKCPPLKSETIEFICELHGVITDCTTPSFEATFVTMQCIGIEAYDNNNNNITDNSYETAVCRDGVWDKPLLTCPPECTRSSIYSSVAIYKNETNANDPKRKYICGGSIISENIILSAAQCFTNESNGELLNLESFFLIPEKSQSSTRKILDVKIPQEYKGKLSNFTGNLALVQLDKPLLISTGGIQIVCFQEPLNYLETIKLGKAREGSIYGKFYRENETGFLGIQTNVYDPVACNGDETEDIETDDKFCAFIDILGPITICFASPGAGYVTNEKYTVSTVFLQGVASFDTVIDKNCTFEVENTTFTAVEKYQPFLKSGIVEFSLCKIPDIQNCSFTISERNYTINESIPNFSIVQVKCHNNFQIFPPFANSIMCNNGMPDKKLPYCIQCGQVRQLKVQDNSTDDITPAEIPWQVEIYQNMNYKCAGTLINSRLMITNSLCFADAVSDYQIIVGKQNMNESNFTQREIVNKDEIKFLDDIALIILKNSFILSENVQPICIDWKDKFGYQELTSAEPGIVLSSNFNDADKNINQNWKIQKFSDVDSSEVFLQEHQKSLLANYFFAKTIEGPNACPEDMGSGIAMRNKDGVYFLRGILTSLTIESLTFCSFIKISYYLPFIINVVESI